MPEWAFKLIVIAVAALLVVFMRRLHGRHVCRLCRHAEVPTDQEPCWSCCCAFPHFSQWERRGKTDAL